MSTTLAALVDVSERAARTASRLAKRDAIAALLRDAEGDEVEIVVAYLAGETRQGRIGVGWATLAGLRGTPASAPSLTLREVDGALAAVAATAGKGSAAARNARLHALFERATAAEQDFLVRLLVGELRQGALEGVMLEAIAAAAGLPAPDVRRAAMVAGGLREVARVALARRRDRCSPASRSRCTGRCSRCWRRRPTISPARWASSAPPRSNGRSTARACRSTRPADEIRVYTRALNDVTASVPEIVEALRALPARELILDGEAIALAADGAPQPFQVTMRRFGRKLDVEAHARRAAARRLLLRLPARRRRVAARPPRARALRRARRGAAARARHPAHRHRRRRGRRGLLRRRARPRPRGRDGQGARRAVRGGPARRELAQGQARAHARPRRARRRVGARAPARAGSRTCTSARAIRRAAASSCSARPSRA